MRNPVIYIRPEVRMKIDLCIRLCKYEISGLGEVTRIGDDFLIEDVHLFKQKVGPGDTDLSQDDIGKFVTECVMKDLDPGNLKFWFHSHANSAAFWSPKDDRTIDKYKNDFMISVVGNKAGRYKARIDVYKPIRLSIDDLDLIPYFEDADDEMIKKLTAEIEEKVTYYAPPATKWVKQKNGTYKKVKKKDNGLDDYVSARALSVIDNGEDDVYDSQTGFASTCGVCTTFDCEDCAESNNFILEAY